MKYTKTIHGEFSYEIIVSAKSKDEAENKLEKKASAKMKRLSKAIGPNGVIERFEDLQHTSIV